MTDYYGKLLEEVSRIWVVDTHEHLQDEASRVKAKVDPLSLFFLHYSSTDLVSAGMSPDELRRIRDPNTPLEERWRILKPYWELVKNTGYGRALLIAMKDLYGIDDLRDDTVKALADKMREANRPGVYSWILKDKGRIEVSIWDVGRWRPEEVDRKFFAPVIRFDDFIMARSRAEIARLERRIGARIHSLSDVVKGLEKLVETVKEHVVGIKTGVAYGRVLRFEKVTFGEAEEAFNKMFRHMGEGISKEEAKPYQDFILHKILQLAGKHSLPVQIHTGIQEGNGNYFITRTRYT